MAYSLIFLAISIILFLFWLATQTLKEGKEALKEISKNSK